MTLREKQSLFVYNVSKLIQFAYEKGFELTAGVFYRTEEQQKIYLEKKLSKAKRSKHQDRLAVDFNLFIDGKLTNENEDYKPLAEYWESLNENNVAGYRWGWDPYHFEMN